MTGSKSQDGDQLSHEIASLRSQLDELQVKIRRKIFPQELPEDEGKYLICEVGNIQVALLLDSLEEVLPVCELLPLPEAPPWVPGLLNLRGKMLPVLDVHTRMHYADRHNKERTKREFLLSEQIIITKIAGERIGLLVQMTHPVRTIATSDIQPSSPDIPQAPYIMGHFEDHGASYLVINLPSLIGTSKISETFRESPETTTHETNP
ncbi:chemotaxis protein CheW [Myxococcota bacterium]|nr:chemotaxis protein CheW [Myxococcota bacterium]